MLQASGRSYVCWRCAARRLRPAGPSSAWLRTPSIPLGKATQHTSSASTRNLATVHHTQSNYDGVNGSSGVEQEPAPRIPRISIRETLRRWEAENPTQAESMLGDYADDGSLSNNLTRPQNTSNLHVGVEDSSPLFGGDELEDLRSDDAMLNRGDLVELGSEGSRRPILAICLGRINGYEHYYTVSGKWFSAFGVKTLFVVNQFATLDELEPVIAALPPTQVSIEDLNVLQDLGEGPSRAAGAVLLRKMLSFAQKSEAVYQANAGTLDASSSFIGDPVKHRYLTLHEIADLLLPETDKHDGKFSAHSLYAVHRALLQDEVFFRPLRYTGHRRSYLFEVSPLSEVRIIQKIEKLVREYLNKQGDLKNRSSTVGSPIESFVDNARKIIDESRKCREWSRNGMIGPSSKRVQIKPNWSATDLEILQFIQLWASYQKFPQYSHLQTFGAALLRAVGRYQEAQGYLPVTGWTFLQEVGWIPPWEIPARYSVRFPDVDIKRGGSYIRPFLGVLDRHLKPDTLSLIRKPLNNVTAYCIDDVTAREIDDAISLEKTSNPDEYWIHVHVADPASSLGADTPVAKHAELIPEAIYLPGHLEPMLPENLIQNRFSLAPDRPCLTFSALLNTNGDVLDEKITANTLKDVIYMTYESAASAVGEVREDPHAEEAEWALGKVPKIETADRNMTQADDLTNKQKSDLATISKLGKVIQARRLEKGATPFFQPRPIATVTFNGVKMKEESDGFITTAGDPKIHVHYSQRSGTDLVENAMKLANEVAARWCHERDIPIPYRTQPHALRNAPLVQQYAQDVLNPMLNSGVRPSEEVWNHMRSLTGVDEVSTTPGPHFTLGSDMYTKATSPLRRFGDLIVHWQIEAALLEEKRLQRKLVRSEGSDKQGDDLSFLPFSRNRLDRMLPMVRLREKQARALTNIDGADQWILQAMVRAWRFKEGPLPETFKLTVLHLTRSRIFGQLDWFERRAILTHSALNNVIVGVDVRVGDIIEVRLTDINVHSKQIFVEALRLLKKAGDKEQGPGSAQAFDGVVKDMPVETI
ncbi:mitochondrial protein cyt-4 [Xylaria telfairii]|nr:mitochondrial protein cyt-4 [Xylaria telfairii]